MRILIIALKSLLIFMGTFFILSLIGMLWQPYTKVISNPDWFVIYSLCIGWWFTLLVMLPKPSLDD
jgi:hypothetical protein